MTRRERLIRALRDWDVLTGMAGNGNGPGDDGLVPIQAHAKGCGVWSTLRCTCWRQSFERLAGSLAELGEREPRLHLHLSARFRQQTLARRGQVRVRGGNWQGLESNQAVVIPDFAPARPPDRLYESVLVASWPTWVEQGLVEAALDRLEALLPIDDPQLPVELWSAVA